jgi:hypothetical protein
MNATEMHDPTDPETPVRDLRRDIGGLVLFALAIFLGVSVVMAARRPDPAAGGTTALFMGLVGWLGVWSPIVLSACLGVLGARLWIAGAAERLARNAVWSLLLALAFAMLFGAASAGSGGEFGRLTGENLTGVLKIWGAVPLTLAVVAGVVWFGWLRPPEWKPVLSPDEPAPSIYTPTDSEGLTVDEAEALLPEQITGRSIPVAPDLPPLYPPDVRREGLIPEGARALEPRDEFSPRTAIDAPPAPALADAPARIPVQPLAQPAGGLAHPAAALAVQPAAQPPAPAVGGSALADLAPAVPRWERPRDLSAAASAPAPIAPAAAPLAAPAGAGFHISVLPVRSAWESDEAGDEASDAAAELLQDPELDEEVDEVDEIEEGLLDGEEESDGEEAELDEGLDDAAEDEEEPDEQELPLAEGTDRSDEVLEVAATVSAARLDLRPETDEAEAATEADEEEAEVDEDLEVLAGLDEDELDEDGEPIDEDDGAWADDGDAEVLAAAVESAPLAADPELAAEVAASIHGAQEPAPEAERPMRPGWEQGGLFDDEPVDAYGTPMTLVEALRHANQETSARLDDSGEVDAAPEAAEAVAPLVEPTPAPAQAATAEPEPETDVPETAAAEPEPRLELQPQPRAAARPREPKAPKTPSPATPPPALEEPEDLVFRAGMLFLERGRVAVSMLQRSFDLDFKEATALLDQLQEAGLIGPYLGGQKRDILLTADEWRQRRVLAR